MEKKDEDSKHILTSFNYDYIKKIFSGDLTLSIIYFLSILIFIIIIFSTDYITISFLFSFYFVHLFFSQIYKIYTSKDKEIGYTTIIIPTFLIVIAIIVNFIVPRNEAISDDVNNPTMEGSVIVIIYSTIIYSILFILFLVYNTYSNNKFLLLGISSFFIISYILFSITRNNIPSSTNSHKKNTIFTNILLFTPCLFSIIYFFFMFANNLKYILGYGLPTGQSNLLYNSKYIEKIQEDPTIQTISTVLNKNYVNILIFCYYVIIFVCFVIFLVSANKTTTKCNFSDYSIYVINALIIVILLYLTIEMTTRGKIKMESETFAKFFNIPKSDLLEKIKIDMTPDDNSKIIFLIIYNVIISKFFNDDCFSIMNNYPSLIILLSYVITIGIYYKIINGENKSKNASNILLYFIVLILFVAVILSINTSKVGSLSSFNGTISPYIYSIIAFSIIFGISYIYIYAKTLNSSIKDNDFIKSLTYSLFILFGLFFFFTLINWIIVLFKTFTFTKSSILGIILNVAIIITLMAILFKMISYSSYYKESPFLQVVIGSIFYIPCLFISLLNRITGIYKNNRESISSGFKFNWTDLLLLIIIIVLYILYFKFTDMYTKYSSQGGNLLLKEPLNTDSKKLLSSYDSLVTQEDQVHSYNYGLSCWLYIDGNNTNDIFYSLIDYGGKPNIQYRGSDNTFMITVDNKLVNGKPIKEKENLDEFGNIIIYKNNDLLLQKWNNIVINYKSGILDIFINGELIQSFKSYIPYMRKDNITSGDKNGNHGGICNVVYFDKSLNLVQIQNLYNSVKDLNPPILLNFYDNLFIHSLKIENITQMLRLNQIDADKYLTL
jgi:hypothetical protein